MADKYKTEIGVDSETLVNHILKSFDEAKKDRGNLEDKWDKNIKQFHGILPEKTEPWRDCSNVFVPISPIVKETYHASLMRSFFSKYTICDIKPVSANDIQTANKRKQFLNWQLRQEIEIRKVADKIVEISLICGNAFPKTRYVTEMEMQTVTRQVPVVGDNGEMVMVDQDVEDEVKSFDGIIVDVPNIDDIYIAPGAVGLQRGESDFVMHRTRCTRNEYYNLVKNADYKKINLKELKRGGERYPERNIQKLNSDILKVSNDLYDSGNFLCLLEFYGEYYDEKKDDIYEIVAVVHPDSRTLCKVFVNKLGFRPFTNFCPFPKSNQVYGEGLMDKLKDLQAEANTIHNQRIDSATLRIAQPFFYNRGSDFDPSKYKIEPMGGYPVDDVRNVYFPQYGDAPASQYREEELLWRYVEQLTAANPAAQGAQTQGYSTATEIAAMSSRSDVRFDLIYKRYEDAFKELYEQVALLDKAYMPLEKEYRIVGGDGRFKWESIKKSEMGGKLDLEIVGLSVANEAMNQQRAITVYQTGIGNPLVMSDPSALYEHTKYLYENMGVMNIDRMIPKPPQASVRTPEEEAELMYKGIPVEPDLREDAQKHLLSHDAEVNQPQFLQEIPQDIQMIFFMHIEKTKSLIASQNMMKSMGNFGQIGSSNIQPNQNAAAAPVGGSGIKTNNE